MDRLIRKYVGKLEAGGLVEKDTALMGAVDAEQVWNREPPHRPVLEEILTGLGCSAILFARPAEPYGSIIDYLANRTTDEIRPRDTETRTFLHALPVVAALTAENAINTLSRRKCAIIPGDGIVTFGTVSPEQAYITFSSVCFSCYVKFFADYLAEQRNGGVTKAQQAVFEKAAAMAGIEEKTATADLAAGPFASEDEVLSAMEDCGRRTVECGLVDSYFGNISYCFDGTLYISQTGSSLDELRGVIDACPLDGSSCAGMTASSELTAHRQIIETTGKRAVLHGHPKFPVILSLDCDRTDCTDAATCHRHCPRERFVGDIPIVSGEVGTGPFGLCHTVPPAMQGRRGVIVYGHGVFAAGTDDFREAFGNLMDIEALCRKTYFEKVNR